MRLMTWKLHRAFPELDRFSDEQCLRFIRATGRSWRRVPHLLAVFVTYMVTGLLMGALVGLTLRAMSVDLSRFDPPVFVAVPLGLVGAVLCAIPAFMVRDRLLRGRVRRVLDTRSLCVRCRYSLLGMPVDEDCIVICPECATPTEVDSSLGELEVGASGERRFAPRRSGHSGWLTERQRRVVKRAAVVCAVVFLVALPGSWGLYEWWLTRQAEKAGAERPQQEQFMALVEEGQPPDAGPGTPNAWELFTRAQLRMMDADAAAGLPQDSKGQEVNPDFTLIYAPRVIELEGEDDWSGKQRQEQDRVAEAAARDRIERYRAAGVFDLMEEMAVRERAVRSLHIAPSQPAVGVLLPELGQSRNMARMNAGRMAVALEKGVAEGTEEWLRAMEANLAIARINRMQPFLLDKLVSVSISALTYERLRAFLKTHADGETLVRVLEALDRQTGAIDMKTVLEGERRASLNTVGWVFMQKKMVRFGRLSKSDPLGFGAETGRVGTWAENRDALNGYFDQAGVLLSTPLRDRPPLDTAPTGLRLVDLMTPALSSAARGFDLAAMEEVGVRTMVALERFYAAEKRYPASLEELVPKYLAGVPVDPWDGKALKYRVHAAGQERDGWGYTLYSVGGDGVDDGGRSPGKDKRHTHFTKTPTLPQGATGTFDFVVNE